MSRSKLPQVIAVFSHGYLEIPLQAFELIATKRGVIFDLDGALVDMEQANYQMYFEVLKKMYSLEITEVEWVKFFAGRRPQESVPDFLKHRKKRQIKFDFEEFKRLAGPIKEDFIFNRLNEVAFLVPGAEQFLERVKKLGNIKLALATSTIERFTTQILKYFGIDDYFDVILTGESVSKGKPDPEIYLKTLQVLKLPAQVCLVFEDSQSGVEAALRAGIEVIRIQNNSCCS